MSRFADLGVSRPVANALSERGITAPFAVQELVIADVLGGHDVLVQSPTGSGKTLAFGVPMVDLIEADARRPAALVLVPTRELATQIVDELRTVAAARALSIAPVYGGVGLEKQAKRAARAHIVVATPGRLEDLLDRGAVHPRPRPGPRHRRGRPDARHGLQARRRPDRRQDAPRPPDHLLLRDARVGGRQGRPLLHERRAPPRPPARGVRDAAPSPTASSTSSTPTRSERWSTSCAARPGARWSSSAPSAARIASSSASASRVSRRWRCTATSPRASASARSRASSAATSRPWSRPTSRPAGSTSSGSPG